jgi:undecaprenyl-diphosphatase
MAPKRHVSSKHRSSPKHQSSPKQDSAAGPHWAGPENIPAAAELAKLPLLSMTAALFAIALFTWLAESVVEQHTQAFDSAIRSTVHSWRSPALTHVMFGITFMGSGGLIILALLAFALFRHFQWRRAAIWLLVTLAGATVLDLALKWAFHRPRPVPFFGPVPHTYSFPSGHSLFSFCFYGVLAGLLAVRVESRRLRVVIWAVAAALILAIGLSRVYLGVHYPSDVLAGYLVGMIWVSSMLVLDRMRARRKSSV